eukprot:1313126-Prymnesium_polylepis.1
MQCLESKALPSKGETRKPNPEVSHGTHTPHGLISPPLYSLDSLEVGTVSMISATPSCRSRWYVAVGASNCESIRLGEGRSRPGLRPAGAAGNRVQQS